MDLALRGRNVEADHAGQARLAARQAHEGVAHGLERRAGPMSSRISASRSTSTFMARIIGRGAGRSSGGESSSKIGGRHGFSTTNRGDPPPARGRGACRAASDAAPRRAQRGGRREGALRRRPDQRLRDRGAERVLEAGRRPARRSRVCSSICRWRRSCCSRQRRAATRKRRACGSRSARHSSRWPSTSCCSACRAS